MNLKIKNVKLIALTFSIPYFQLDKTYTGLQTLGAETLVDVWLQEVNSDSRSEEQGNIYKGISRPC